MTESAEALPPARPPQPSLGALWRMQRERAQEAVIPSGQVVVSCSAALGLGGLGRHFKELVGALERREQPTVCISGAGRERDSRPRLALPTPARLLSRLPIRQARGWGARAFFAEFDAYAAERLPAAEHLVAFNGQALAQLGAARRVGYESASLLSANSHLRRVVRQHALAHRQYPLEESWARRLLQRNLKEYARADHIYVASQYTRESFLDEGFPDEMISHFPFTPDPRFAPGGAAPADTYEIVYAGSLSVAKGVPLLIDAFRRLPHRDLRLRLIGGWATPGMRRFIERACAEDHRIDAGAGDPLSHLQRARLCVHATYEDGFAYAPAEALACGVPVIVSEDTGMKELIELDRDGLILPTGDLSALAEAIDAAYRGEVLAPAGGRAGNV